jgi:hypothetical protein
MLHRGFIRYPLVAVLAYCCNVHAFVVPPSLGSDSLSSSTRIPTKKCKGGHNCLESGAVKLGAKKEEGKASKRVRRSKGTAAVVSKTDNSRKAWAKGADKSVPKAAGQNVKPKADKRTRRAKSPVTAVSTDDKPPKYNEGDLAASVLCSKYFYDGWVDIPGNLQFFKENLETELGSMTVGELRRAYRTEEDLMDLALSVYCRGGATRRFL